MHIHVGYRWSLSSFWPICVWILLPTSSTCFVMLLCQTKIFYDFTLLARVCIQHISFHAYILDLHHLCSITGHNVLEAPMHNATLILSSMKTILENMKSPYICEGMFWFWRNSSNSSKSHRCFFVFIRFVYMLNITSILCRTHVHCMQAASKSAGHYPRYRC